MPDSQFNGVVATWEWDVATRQLTWSPELEAFGAKRALPVNKLGDEKT